MDEKSMSEWLSIAIQAGGAIAVTAMFIWYLIKKAAQDDASRDKFLAHMAANQEAHLKHMEQRDAQSKEIALSGHAALHELSGKVSELREEIRR